MTALDFKIKIWDKPTAEVIERNVPSSCLMHTLVTMLFVSQKMTCISDLMLSMLARCVKSKAWSYCQSHSQDFCLSVFGKKFPLQISLALLEGEKETTLKSYFFFFCLFVFSKIILNTENNENIFVNVLKTTRTC